MSQVILIAVASLLAALGGLWGLWMWRQRAASRSVVWTPQVEQQALDVAAGWGMGTRSVRTLFGRRLVQAWGRRGRMTWQLELCTSARGSYIRLIGQPDESLGQGVRIMREATSGALGWLWRMREVELGDEELDARLVLLAQDEARLRVLLGTQLKAELLALDELVDRLEVGDEGMFLQVERVTSVEALASLLSAGINAMERLEALARAWGGLNSARGAAYGEAQDKREEGEATLDTIELADPGSTTGKMSAIQPAEEGGSRSTLPGMASSSGAASSAPEPASAASGAGRG